MKKLATIVLSAALVLSACGGGGSTAATVDDAEISTSFVESLMYDPASVVEKEIFARYLGAAIQLQILFTAAAADYGVDPSDEDVAAEADTIYEENQLDQTRDEFLEAAGISEDFFQDIARQQVVVAETTAVIGSDLEPTTEEIESATADATEVCAAHILVETEEEAAEVVDRLGSGEDFAELAVELSTDTGSGANGGDLGCAPPTRYVAEFADASMTAEIGVPTEPVMTQFGYHVILVNSRNEPTGDQINEIIAADEFNEWYITAVAAADVVVEEEYGTWNPGPPPSVTPPAA